MADLTLHLKDRDIELSWAEFQELINKFSNNPAPIETPMPMPYYYPIYVNPYPEPKPEWQRPIITWTTPNTCSSGSLEIS